ASLWGLKIYNISAIADTMSFTVGTGPVAVLPAGMTQKHFIAQPSPMRELFDLRGVRIGRLIGSPERSAFAHAYAGGTYVSRTIGQGRGIISAEYVRLTK
ncbi:MAG: hypothetical protein JXA71_19025, partial [Chitinispirillaceae bacterium]|nr:hypothetical protein [Chitinispirillaceae bacterium]